MVDELMPLPLVLCESYLVPVQYAESNKYIARHEALLLMRAELRRLYEQGERQQVLRMKHQGIARERQDNGDLKLTLRVLLEAFDPNELVEINMADGGVIRVRMTPLQVVAENVPGHCRGHLIAMCRKCGARYDSKGEPIY